MQTITPHAQLPTLAVDRDITLRGMVHRVRALGSVSFVHLRTERGLVQCVLGGPPTPGLCPHAAVEIEGRCVRAKLREPSLAYRHLEVRMTSLVVLSTPEEPPPFDVSKPVLEAGAAALLDHRSLSLRHPAVGARFRVQQELVRGFRQALFGQAFQELHSPKLAAAAAEGGSQVFSLDYFGRTATLAQSPQLYKELCTGAFNRVFEVGPVFRAEKHATSRHLAEYTSLDLEMGPILGFHEIMQMATLVLGASMERVREQCAPQLALLGATLPEVGSIPAVRFHEAQSWVGATGDDLSGADEAAIGAVVLKKTGSELVFITHYPTTKRPFYAMEDPAEPHLTVSFDLLFRGVEIVTGGQRIHRRSVLVKKMRRMGLKPESMAFFHQAHGYGLPPHGGMGMGLERLTQQLLGLGNIREATLFPRDRMRLTP
jgi:nondiscriminating aspartyl-tRNA synthetase